MYRQIHARILAVSDERVSEKLACIIPGAPIPKLCDLVEQFRRDNPEFNKVLF
jgi:hypothetical protein